MSKTIRLGNDFASFGLREEWLTGYLYDESYLQNNSLGPRQRDALLAYLRYAGLIDGNKQPIPLYTVLKSILEREPLLVWAVVWLNLASSSPLFQWWAAQPRGTWDASLVLQMLADYYGAMNRFVENCWRALLSTLQHTPIGSELGIGVVTRFGRLKTVSKAGNYRFDERLVVYGVFKAKEFASTLAFETLDVPFGLSTLDRVLAVKREYLVRMLLEASRIWPELVELRADEGTFKMEIRQSYDSLQALKVVVSERR